MMTGLFDETVQNPKEGSIVKALALQHLSRFKYTLVKLQMKVILIN